MQPAWALSRCCCLDKRQLQPDSVVKQYKLRCTPTLTEPEGSVCCPATCQVLLFARQIDMPHYERQLPERKNAV